MTVPSASTRPKRVDSDVVVDGRRAAGVGTLLSGTDPPVGAMVKQYTLAGASAQLTSADVINTGWVGAPSPLTFVVPMAATPWTMSRPLVMVPQMV